MIAGLIPDVSSDFGVYETASSGSAFADQHFLIEKQEQGGRTKTGVRQLSKDQPRQEIARMLSGAQVTETSLKHAEQMLKSSG